jgi:hypothetical protein
MRWDQYSSSQRLGQIIFVDECLTLTKDVRSKKSVGVKSDETEAFVWNADCTKAIILCSLDMCLGIISLIQVCLYRIEVKVLYDLLT